MQPVNDMSYFGCLDSVMENSKVRGARNPEGRGQEGGTKQGLPCPSEDSS